MADGAKAVVNGTAVVAVLDEPTPAEFTALTRKAYRRPLLSEVNV